jgi:hypothetical protein
LIETEIPGDAMLIETEAAVTVTGVVAESETETLKANAPVAVGVPEIAPVVLLNVSPVGSAPIVIAKVFVPEPPLAEMLESL